MEQKVNFLSIIVGIVMVLASIVFITSGIGFYAIDLSTLPRIIQLSHGILFIGLGFYLVKKSLKGLVNWKFILKPDKPKVIVFAILIIIYTATLFIRTSTSYLSFGCPGETLCAYGAGVILTCSYFFPANYLFPMLCNLEMNVANIITYWVAPIIYYYLFASAIVWIVKKLVTKQTSNKMIFSIIIAVILIHTLSVMLFTTGMIMQIICTFLLVAFVFYRIFK